MPLEAHAVVHVCISWNPPLFASSSSLLNTTSYSSALVADLDTWYTCSATVFVSTIVENARRGLAFRRSWPYLMALPRCLLSRRPAWQRAAQAHKWASVRHPDILQMQSSYTVTPAHLSTQSAARPAQPYLQLNQSHRIETTGRIAWLEDGHVWR